MTVPDVPSGNPRMPWPAIRAGCLSRTVDFCGSGIAGRRSFSGHSVLGIFRKADRNRILGAACLDVNTTWAVTRFAVASLVGSVRMRHRFANCCSIEASALILVTDNAGIATDNRHRL